jgi:hypothetical protein
MNKGENREDILSELATKNDRDTRTIERWISNYVKANEEKAKEAQRSGNPQILKAKQDHFDQLADMADWCSSLNLNTVRPINGASTQQSNQEPLYYLAGEGKNITTDELRDRIISLIDWGRAHFGALMDHFITHLAAEFDNIRPQECEQYLLDNPYLVVDMIRNLALRKTFKGKCPVCQDW